MSVRTSSGRDGALRIYDGSTPPKYIELKFELMNLSGPIARPRGIENTVVTTGGFIHSPTSPDFEGATYEPVSVNFSFWVNSVDYVPIRAALSNLDMADPWKVGGDTWATTKGRGSLVRSDGSYIPTQLFFDTTKKTVDIQTRWTSPAMNGSIIGQRWDEAYFAPQNVSIQESADFLEIRCLALVYGNIQPIGDFSTGVSSI